MKPRNPIAKVVKQIRQKIVPNKKRTPPPDVDDLHEMAARLLERNNRKRK